MIAPALAVTAAWWPLAASDGPTEQNGKMERKTHSEKAAFATTQHMNVSVRGVYARTASALEQHMYKRQMTFNDAFMSESRGEMSETDKKIIMDRGFENACTSQ